MSLDFGQLGNFLRQANKHSYAAGQGKTSSSRAGSKDLEYFDGKWTFHDTYFGAKDYIGEEIVYEDNVPIWGANYYGYMMGAGIDAEEVYVFLKKALLSDSHGTIPVRGPESFAEDGYVYENEVEGSLERFSGKEQISRDGKVVYEALYHGGLIQ